MDRKIVALAATVLIAGFAALNGQETAIKIIYVSKMPDIEASAGGGLPELAALVRQARAASQSVLFLHGGDSLAPSALSLFDRGSHMIDILNVLRPDAMAVNEREFAFKEDELVLRANEASFPFVCSNILDPLSGGNLSGIEDDLMIERGGFRIGVFAIIDPLVSVSYLPDRIRVKDVAATISSEAAKLRGGGADIVILLTGYQVEGLDKYLADGTLDLALVSSSKADSVFPRERGMLALQGMTGGTAAAIDVFAERKEGAVRARFAGRILSLSDYPPDPETKRRVDGYKATLSSFMDVKVGIVETAMDTSKNAVRTAETAFGNLVTDALRSYYGADAALVNGGSIRGNRQYPAGVTLTRKDIQTELPFANLSRFVSLTGAQLSEAMENSFSQIEEVKGRFLQVSGMSVVYDPAAAVGRRVRSISVGGRPLKADQRYTIATLDFLVEGGDGFDVLKTASAVKTSKSSLPLWEIVRLYLEQKRKVSPRVEGRIVAKTD